VFISFTLLSLNILSIVIYYGFNQIKLEQYLPKILYNDSQGYEPKKVEAQVYFDIKKRIENKEQSEQKETTRELKEVVNIDNKDILILQGNNNDVNDNAINNEHNEIKINNFITESVKVTPSPVTEKKLITIKDYEELECEELYLDERNFMTMLKDLLVLDHSLISLVYKRSLFDPAFIRLNQFAFECSLQFCFNALLFTDSYIDQRATSPNRVTILLN
jgi:hypothetical protein